MQTTTPPIPYFPNLARVGDTQARRRGRRCVVALAAIVLSAGCQGHLVTFDNIEGAPKSTQLAEYGAPVWPAPTRTCAAESDKPYQLGVSTRRGFGNSCGWPDISGRPERRECHKIDGSERVDDHVADAGPRPLREAPSNRPPMDRSGCGREAREGATNREAS